MMEMPTSSCASSFSRRSTSARTDASTPSCSQVSRWSLRMALCSTGSSGMGWLDRVACRVREREVDARCKLHMEQHL